MPVLLDAREALRLLAPFPGGFAAVGAGADVDEAFDDAVDTAMHDFGRSRVVPSLACVDAGSVEVVEPVVTSRDLALGVAVRALASGGVTPGVAYAVALCENSAFRRRRLTLRFDDPTLGFPDLPGPLGLSDRVLAAVGALAAASPAPLEAAEAVEAVTLTRVRSRFKVTAQPNRGGTERSFAAMAGPTVVLAGAATAGEARRAAVALAKAGPLAGAEEFTLDVVAAPRRTGGLPLVSVRRARVAQRGALRVVVAARKETPRPPRQTGWLFFGLVPPA